MNINKPSLFSEIIGLIQREVILEWRQKHVLGGIFLYLVSTIFICYLAFRGIMSLEVWNALFWIIMAFSSLNLVLKSFQDETTGRKLYLYTLVSPASVIISKTIVNAFIMIVLGVLGFLFFNLFMGNIASANVAYWFILVAGVFGFSSILTVVSAIASQTKNNFTLMTILGFPLILPLLLLVIRSASITLQGSSLSAISGDLLLIALLIMISLTLSHILFPYLWKD